MKDLELLERLGKRGIYVGRKGDGLLVTGKTGNLPSGLASYIREMKQSLVALLARYPRFNNPPPTDFPLAITKPSESRQSSLVEMVSWQHPSVIQWVMARAQEYQSKCPSWSMKDCEYSAMRDVVQYQGEQHVR